MDYPIKKKLVCCAYLIILFRDHTLQLLPLSEVHVSLSRTVPIQHHHIEPLTTALRSEVRIRSPFKLHLSSVAVYVNDDKTRWVWSVTITKVGVVKAVPIACC